jgi:ABC-type amino acid transport substrate-binding protein
MSTRSNRLLLGIALAGLILESLVSHPALATDKVSLFKVITAKDEIIIGINDDQLSTFEAKNAGGVAKHLEQAPLRQVGLMSTEALRVEPYTTPLKIVPLPDVTGQ